MITKIDRNTALVLIDFQQGIVKIQIADQIKAVLQNAALLVQAFHKLKLPIFVINVDPIGAIWTKIRTEAPAILPKAESPTIVKKDMPQNRFTDIISEIQTQPEDIHITKKTWNAFFQTPLHDELQKKNITQIVLCGISTSIGVEGTARAASELGYNIAFATDAMTDPVAESHNNSLRHIFPRIGESGSTKEISKILAEHFNIRLG